MMDNSLEELTRALQKLVADRKRGEPIQDIPKYISADTFKLPPGIEKFLEKRRAYFEKTRNVSVGVY